MNHPYPSHISQQKANHIQRMNVTEQDKYFYREPEPKLLSTDQKDQIMQVEEDRKIDIVNRELSWREKRYADSTFRDEGLWG